MPHALLTHLALWKIINPFANSVHQDLWLTQKQDAKKVKNTLRNKTKNQKKKIIPFKQKNNKKSKKDIRYSTSKVQGLDASEHLNSNDLLIIWL